MVIDNEWLRQCGCDLLPERRDDLGRTAEPGGTGGLRHGRRQDTSLLALNLPGSGGCARAAAFEELDEVVDGEVVGDGDAVLLGEMDDGAVEGFDLGSLTGREVLEG